MWVGCLLNKLFYFGFCLVVGGCCANNAWSMRCGGCLASLSPLCQREMIFFIRCDGDGSCCCVCVCVLSSCLPPKSKCSSFIAIMEIWRIARRQPCQLKLGDRARQRTAPNAVTWYNVFPTVLYIYTPEKGLWTGCWRLLDGNGLCYVRWLLLFTVWDERRRPRCWQVMVVEATRALRRSGSIYVLYICAAAQALTADVRLAFCPAWGLLI